MFTALLTQTAAAPVWAFHFALQGWLLWGGIAVAAVGIVSALLFTRDVAKTYKSIRKVVEPIVMGALLALAAAAFIAMAASISYLAARDASLSTWMNDTYGTSAEGHITDLEKGRAVHLKIDGHVRAVQLIADLNNPDIFRLYESTALVPLPASRG